jgi:uncharacterized membrane protein YfhO
MASPGFDPWRVAVVESRADALPGGSDEVRGTIQLVEMGPGRYAMTAECSVDALLVLSEATYPGWTATVDGAPAAVIPADHLLQAVRLPPGRHEVRFAYRSRYLGLGFALAAAGLLVPLALIVLRARKA